MAISRREFLRNGTGAVLAGSMASGVLADGETEAGRRAGDRALVVIELSGGNDALNTLIPVHDAAYTAGRPTLAISPARALMLDGRVGLHPAMEAMHRLFRDGRLAIVQGVGYPNPSRSHFRSSEIWHRGDFSQLGSGWLGRYCQRRSQKSEVRSQRSEVRSQKSEVRGQKSEVGNRESDLTSDLRPLTFYLCTAVHFGHEMPELFKAESFSAIGVYTEEELHPLLRVRDGVEAGSLRMVSSVQPLNAAEAPNLARCQSLLGRPRQARAVYPMDRMGTALSTFAQLIVQRAGPKLFYVNQSGYDTHARQTGLHGAPLTSLSRSVGAFLDDLKAERRDREVLVMVFSEFGRRLKENSSAGTDHGSAGLMMFAGGEVKGGLYGRYPSLSDLHGGDLRYSVDFRDCYATVLERWLDVEAGAIVKTRGRVDFV